MCIKLEINQGYTMMHGQSIIKNGQCQVFSFNPENGSSRFLYLQDVRVFQPTAEYGSLNYHYREELAAPHVSVHSKEIRCDHSQLQSQQPHKV